MSGPDSYYTPPFLADKLISFITPANIARAIDFCVGDGDLLKAVAKRYADIDLFGTDISDEALAKLSDKCPDWHLGECDFRNDDSIGKVDFLKEGLFDLIVLNPPFTCKGGIVEKVLFDDQEFHVSTAMLFLMRALKYLAPNGGLYAILPISCVYSIKDRKAWTYLKNNYNACILDEPNKVSFTSKCAPNIALVYAGHYKVHGVEQVDSFQFSSLPVTSVVRGSIRMQNLQYNNSHDSVSLIHTTNLRNGKLVGLRRILAGSMRMISGCGVIIPRVCNPNPNKVVLFDDDLVYALSDCVVFLKTNTSEEAEMLRNAIIDHWCDFLSVYKGTGAQYTTVERLKNLFGIL